MQRDEVRVFAPATISNFGLGFNMLGLALNGLGNVVAARGTTGTDVRLVSLDGVDQSPPLTVDHHPAGLAVLETLKKAGIKRGVDLAVRRDIPAGCGLGGEASMAVAAAFATNKLLGSPLRKHELVGPSMIAQADSSAPHHPDQVAAALLGGLILVHCVKPIDLIRVPLPSDLRIALVIPQPGRDTGRERHGLPEMIARRDAAQSAANIAAFTTACFTSDIGLLSRCFAPDPFITARCEPIPGSGDALRAAAEAGAVLSSVCGLGPAVFALCRSARSAKDIVQVMGAAFENVGTPSSALISPVDCPGARVERQ